MYFKIKNSYYKTRTQSLKLPVEFIFQMEAPWEESVDALSEFGEKCAERLNAVKGLSSLVIYFQLGSAKLRRRRVIPKQETDVKPGLEALAGCL